MRYVVDAMNVIGTRPDGWWRDRDAAMARLVDRLERYVAASGDDVTVVFERKCVSGWLHVTDQAADRVICS